MQIGLENALNYIRENSFSEESEEYNYIEKSLESVLVKNLINSFQLNIVDDDDIFDTNKYNDVYNSTLYIVENASNYFLAIAHFPYMKKGFDGLVINLVAIKEKSSNNSLYLKYNKKTQMGGLKLSFNLLNNPMIDCDLSDYSFSDFNTEFGDIYLDKFQEVLRTSIEILNSLNIEIKNYKVSDTQNYLNFQQYSIRRSKDKRFVEIVNPDSSTRDGLRFIADLKFPLDDFDLVDDLVGILEFLINIETNNLENDTENLSLFILQLKYLSNEFIRFHWSSNEVQMKLSIAELYNLSVGYNSTKPILNIEFGNKSRGKIETSIDLYKRNNMYVLELNILGEIFTVNYEIIDNQIIQDISTIIFELISN